MRRHRDMSQLTPAERGACAAIGNFDGVHLGHQAVIAAARGKAASLGAALGVVTFEPHPREWFNPGAAPFRLMNAGARARRLEKLGVDAVYEVPFDADLAALSSEAFVRDVLRGRLGLGHAVVGADFRFGRGRAGDAAALRELGEAAGMGVTVVPMLDLGEGEVSSTAIRAALSDGRPRDAARMLGHWHRVEGEVVRGDQRGRTLGYPTANMAMDGLHPPRFGVYASQVDVLDGPHRGRFGGATSIGVRPTFGANAANCETYLLDFDGDIYGATLSVALLDFLRPEVAFEGVPALVEQMGRDVAEAREVLVDA